MNRETHSTLIENALHHVHHTQAVLAYAATDPAFAESLAHYVQNQYWQPVSLPIEEPSPYAIPVDQHDAIRVTHWLMQELEEQPEAYSARGALAAWAGTYKEPKNFVLGIVGLAIIGPTLGILDNKKKKKTKLQLVVDETWAQSFTPEQLVEKTHELSQAVIAKELRSARGKLECLHPDTADWCMAGSGTKLYCLPQTQVELICTTLAAEQLSHIAIYQKEKLVALGISPSINDQLVEETLK
jgi:hypothetical protein